MWKKKGAIAHCIQCINTLLEPITADKLWLINHQEVSYFHSIQMFSYDSHSIFIVKNERSNNVKIHHLCKTIYGYFKLWIKSKCDRTTAFCVGLNQYLYYFNTTTLTQNVSFKVDIFKPIPHLQHCSNQYIDVFLNKIDVHKLQQYECINTGVFFWIVRNKVCSLFFKL